MLTPERKSQIIAAQVRYQQRKLVRRALDASGIPVHQEAARRAEALRLLKMPLGDLLKLTMGEQVGLAKELFT